MLEFRILGPLEVVGSAGPVHLGGSKQRGTLAILLLNANRVVAIDTLADQLYAGRAPVTAATQVHRQISELRKALGDEARIETRTPGYAIRVTPEQLDLKRFERLTEEAAGALARGEPRAALELQREALSLWRGPALADLDEPFAQNAIRRLEEILLVALEQRLDAELGLGRHRELVGELGELVAQHPANESFVSRLMLALYRSGRQADALDVYRRTRERLVEQFGIEPGRALRELERAILNQDESLDAAATAAFAVPAPEQVVLVLPSADERLDALLAVAEPLAAVPGRALLIARLLAHESLLSAASADLSGRRASLGPAARTAAFTTLDRADDAVRLAAAYDVRLVLLDAATASWFPSAGASTTGLRSSSEPGWRRPARPPSGWWACGRTPDGVAGTRVVCSPMRRSRCSESSGSMPSPSSSTRPRSRSSRRQQAPRSWSRV